MTPSQTITQDDGTTTTAREIRLRRRPRGMPSPEDFEIVAVPLPVPADGEVLVENTWFSVDPYMRGRMDAGPSYMPPFELGAPLEGSAVGRVVESRTAAIPVGATVSHFAGWRSHAVLGADAAIPLDTTLAREQDYLGPLGTTGLTAYVAVEEIAPVREGDVVFVSAAAGAVGSIAGQLARQAGASRVIGSVGSEEKARAIVAGFGFDDAIVYPRGRLSEQLRSAAPDGIDVYFDAVGGDHLDAALEVMNDHGRVALVGAISGYNAAQPPAGPQDFFRAYAKRLTLRGMFVSDHLDTFGEFIPKAAKLLADGDLRTETTVVEGLDRAPGAFLDLFRGTNVGKMLVKL